MDSISLLGEDGMLSYLSPPTQPPFIRKFASTYPITTFCLSKALFLVEYDNVALHRLPIIRLPVDIQKIPNTSRLQYRYEQWPKNVYGKFSIT
jgi:hypothetical protein